MARRSLPGGTLAFLDAMTCGLGAVILLFVVINAAIDQRATKATAGRQSEVDRLQDEVLEGFQNLVELRNSLQEVEDRNVTAQGLARRVMEEIIVVEEELAQYKNTTTAKREHINKLKADLKSIEEDSKRLVAAATDEGEPGTRRRSFIGDGDRQYLTGLKVGGKRIFILVDASASMLGRSVVNAIRRTLLPDSVKVQADKWQRAVASVDWLLTQIPQNSRFQLYTFNIEAGSVLPNTDATWLDGGDPEVVGQVVEHLRKVVPREGTNLLRGLEALQQMNPPPDNLILLVDGLPTQGRRAPKRSTISGKDRLELFDEAFYALRLNLPINVILYPMEGDPMAASAYWKQVIQSGGAFLSPSEDWP